MLSTELRDQIIERALQISAELDAKLGPYHAEIVPTCSPKWHIVTFFSGQDENATDHLAKRGVGVFVPRFAKGAKLKQNVPADELRGERAHQIEVDLSNRLIFPGRAFVFVWDVLKHWRRIHKCPGVRGIMLDDQQRPIVIDDASMNRIQFLQFSLTPMGKPVRKRYQKRRQADHDDGEQVLTISTKAYWHVDGEQRNRVLDESLGLA